MPKEIPDGSSMSGATCPDGCSHSDDRGARHRGSGTRRSALSACSTRRSAGSPGSRLLRDEEGSAVAEFSLVGVLLTALLLAVVQLALALHVRNTVLDAAAEGARYAALPVRRRTPASSAPALSSTRRSRPATRG